MNLNLILLDPDETRWLIGSLAVFVGLPLLIIFIGWLRNYISKRRLQSGRHEAIVRWNYTHSEWARFVEIYLDNEPDYDPFDEEDRDGYRQNVHTSKYNSDTVMPSETIISPEQVIFNKLFFKLGNMRQQRASYSTGVSHLLFIDYKEKTKYHLYKRRMTIPVPGGKKEEVKEVVDRFNAHYVTSWWWNK